jgi:hypothetical protein
MISVNGDEGSPDYAADGNVGFCSPTNLGGMLSLWEVYSVERRNHFHTTDTGERDRAYHDLDYDDNGRVDIRECYVWPR